MLVRSVFAVFWFEWYRALTFARLAWWAVLAFFPTGIVLLIRSTSDATQIPYEPWTFLLFGLVPMLVSMLGTFLWASPAISSELEGRSWPYLAVRPHGTTALLLGKYLVTVTWVMSAALVGLAVAAALIPLDEAFRIGGVIARLTFLSVPSYAAVYLLIGVLFPKRSMVICVAYTLIFEFLLSMVPALVNTLTVQFRLRTLLIFWSGISVGKVNNALLAFIGEPPAWEHALILVAYPVVLLAASIAVIRMREFSGGEDAEG